MKSKSKEEKDILRFMEMAAKVQSNAPIKLAELMKCYLELFRRYAHMRYLMTVKGRLMVEAGQTLLEQGDQAQTTYIVFEEALRQAGAAAKAHNERMGRRFRRSMKKSAPALTVAAGAVTKTGSRHRIVAKSAGK